MNTRDILEEKFDGEYDTCPDCGNVYKRVALHWAKSSTCNYPRFTQKQQELLKGILLVTGNIDTQSKYPNLTLRSINREILEWIRHEFGVKGVDITENTSSERAAEQLQGIRDRPVEEIETSTIYAFKTRTNPQLEKFHTEWYNDDGDRTVPENIRRSRNMLLIAYGLGGWLQTEPRTQARLSVGRTMPSVEIVENLFDGFGPATSYSGGTKHIKLNNTEAFFDYIGWEPLPGCGDKWPTPDTISEPDQLCPTCNGRFERLGKHWQSHCSPPPLNTTQKEILRGIAICKPTARQRSKQDISTILRVDSTNENALNTISKELGWVSSGIRTAIKREQDPDGQRDIHALSLKAIPALEEYDLNNHNPFSAQMIGNPRTMGTIALLRGYLSKREEGKCIIYTKRTVLNMDEMLDLFEEFNAEPADTKQESIILHKTTAFLDTLPQEFAKSLNSY